MWFRDLTDEYGGDLSRMVTLRGVENLSSQIVESQLNVKTTQMTRLLGPTVIEDQAVIGRDLFMNEGATIGVVFKARNAFLLRSSLNTDRMTLANADESVTLTEVEIAGTKVSKLASSDNRVRSFMLEDGEGYFCVTNSEHLAKRFLEVSRSGESLGATKHFRLSRSLVPVDRDDTLFAYFFARDVAGIGFTTLHDRASSTHARQE